MNYETESEMRQRARNAEADHPDDAYYGIKGIPKQSNRVVASFCGLLILCGWLYFYLGFK